MMASADSSMSGESPIAGLRTADFSLCPYEVEMIEAGVGGGACLDFNQA